MTSNQGSAHVGPEPIDPMEVVRHVEKAAAGAVITFIGTVRNEDDGRPVTALEYEAHPQAADALAAVVRLTMALPGVQAAAASHRTGLLQVGDIAFVAAVSAGHRREAFEACARLVDEAKARVPIWKRQEYADGGQSWVGTP